MTESRIETVQFPVACFTDFSSVTIFEHLLCVRQNYMPLLTELPSLLLFECWSSVQSGEIFVRKFSPLPPTFFISIPSLIKQNKKSSETPYGVWHPQIFGE